MKLKVPDPSDGDSLDLLDVIEDNPGQTEYELRQLYTLWMGEELQVVSSSRISSYLNYFLKARLVVKRGDLFYVSWKGREELDKVMSFRGQESLTKREESEAFQGQFRLERSYR